MVDKLTVKAIPRPGSTAKTSNKDIKVLVPRTDSSKDKGDSFTSTSTIKNVKVLLPNDLNTYNKTITFEVEKGHKPKIIYSGANETQSIDKESFKASNFETEAITLKKLPNPDPKSKNDIYSVSVKKGWNVNFDIDGTTINYDAPLTEGSPSLDITPKDLKVLASTEAGFSRIITFNTNEKEIPHIIVSGRKEKITFSNKGIDLSAGDSYDDESLSVTKVKRQGKNEYTIKVKDGWLTSFHLGKIPVNYNAPLTTPSAPSLTSIPKVSGENVLLYENSGKSKYPKSHSVFANNVQESNSTSIPDPPTSLGAENYKKCIKEYDEDYRKIPYGSFHIKELAYELCKNKGNISIEQALASISKEYSNDPYSHKPVYRLSEESTHKDNSKDFEVLVLTANNYDERFNFDAEVLECAITKSYGDRCKQFKIVRSPNEKEFIDAIKERAKSAKANKRKLYIMYRGHGDWGSHQEGVTEENKTKQGSRSYEFGFGGFTFSEEKYKEICNEELKDVETIHYINSCHPGAAVTATESEKQKEMFNCVA
jgi:hypothetical protein